MSDLFHIIEGGLVVLQSRGVYYQKKVYQRGGRLFASWGGGFIRLGARIGPAFGTSKPDVSWESLDLPAEVVVTMDSIKGPTV